MALHLARRRQRFPTNSSLIRVFSNSSSDSPPKNLTPSEEKPSQPPSSSSYFSDPSPFSDIIKNTLSQQLQEQQEQARNSFSRSNPQAQNRGSTRFSDNQSRVSFQDLGKNLANFERRPTVPPSRVSGGVPPSHSRPQVSFEALYKQNVVPNSSDRKGNDFISSKTWENLQNLRPLSNASSKTERTRVSLRSLPSTLKTGVSNKNVRSKLFEGVESLPASVFAKEMDGEADETKTEFLTTYSEGELGEKLRFLRPEGHKEEGWFSLQELNQRLVKLRQLEVKETQNQRGEIAVFRNVFGAIKNEKDKSLEQNYDVISHMGLGATPEYKLHPPKEHLAEAYFHIDNLSSAEKMKMELTKVREEFKMSESDCGSARVQVAQLTTKIKHLSSALHKKDKHSRKGLLGMVQKRKKLLKYLRRTDWDSYCLVLSKLSLRDNPDYKF